MYAYFLQQNNMLSFDASQHNSAVSEKFLTKMIKIKKLEQKSILKTKMSLIKSLKTRIGLTINPHK